MKTLEKKDKTLQIKQQYKKIKDMTKQDNAPYRQQLQHQTNNKPRIKLRMAKRGNNTNDE